MKQTYRLNENELTKLITECVNEMLAENVDEKFLGGLRDTLGAAKDTFTKGGSFAAHKANRNLQTARGDIQQLNQKYGRQDFNGNDAQWKKQMTGTQIDANNASMEQQIQDLEAQKQVAMQQVAAKYDQKISALRNKYGAKNDRINAKAQRTIDNYRGQKNALDNARNTAYQKRRDAVNANPYTDFKE